MLDEARINGYRENGICRYCGGAEQLDIPKEGMTYCACMILREEHAHRNMQEYATKHPDVNLNEFEVWGDADSKLVLSQALKDIREWISKIDRWLMIAGPVGTGKSHLLHTIDTILKPWSMYISVPDFKDMVFEFTGNGDLSTMLDYVSRHPILLLDDVGAEWASAYAVTALRQVIMSRYTHWRELPIVIATNLTESQLETYDSRIADRLFDKEKVDTILFNGVKSWRRHGN
jgi:DNA replication protein DnaC